METIDKVYLYGASGHAKVVMDLARLACVNVPCLIDDNILIKELEGVSVVHSADGLSPIIVTIGDCLLRRKVVEKLGARVFLSLMHPSAIKAETASYGDGTVIMGGAILNAYASIGNHCIINTGASVDHDCVIGDFVHIAPHCTLCGDVKVGQGTWIGAGTTVIQGIHIGNNCFIGAGSVVVKDIPDNSFCFGNPCKVKRTV